MRIKGLSAVVVTYNRADVVEACLTGARFAEELVVVDKSSSDGTDVIGKFHADKFFAVPWSPTVEDTRAFAVDQAAHEWILLLDDDECLSPACIDAIAAFVAAPTADICYLPLRHFILGRHDEAAYYWPEHHPRLFRRGAIVMRPTIHGGFKYLSDRVHVLSHDDGSAILHLSHADARTWIEKTNRYTSMANRAGKAGTPVTPETVRAALDEWLGRVPAGNVDPYVCAVASLRAVYDIVDMVKGWEASERIDGPTLFRDMAAKLRDANLRRLGGRAAPLAPPELPDEDRRDGHDKLMAWAWTILDGDEALRGQLGDARREGDRLRAALDDEHALRCHVEQELAQALERLSTIERFLGVPAPIAGGRRGTLRDRGDRQRLLALHTRIRESFAAARAKVAKRELIHSPPKRSWRDKLLRRSALPRTRLYDPAWVAGQAPGAERVGLRRFLANPAFRAVSPHPLFDARFYLEQNADVASGIMSPLAHYLTYGWREGRDPHPMFANDWYLDQNPDVLAGLRGNPLDHYLAHGWREGRWPNPVFDPRGYLDRYPDIAAAGTEPLTHYVAHGRSEKRQPQFRGDAVRWQRLLPPNGRFATVFDFLLFASPAEAFALVAPTEGFDAPAEAEELWPPLPEDEDFQLPQDLRDLLLNKYDDETFDLFVYLCAVMETYREHQEAFAGSEACKRLLERSARRSAAAAARMEGGGSRLPPEASIIIPVYNNIVDTLLCVVSLLEMETSRRFEIIVADDGSTDATAQIIGAVGGVVRYWPQPQNYGFLGNCNHAAEQAHGDVLILLNNDTLVMPGWLDGLLEPFERFDRVGLVGSRLLNWDGTLQEAGGIFWRDGSAWNFGRNQDSQAPEFSYLKDADYISGASIAVPAAIWREMNGFDPAYSPAYCEDSDLAFRLREAGYRTLYSPASEVMHHEGRSHGRDVSAGIKAYQVTNQARLFDRWKEVLERDHYPNGENVLRARDRSFDHRHILIVDHYVPQWDRDAGSRTMYDFICSLIDEGWSVTFWPDNLWRDPEYTPPLQALGVEVIYGAAYRDQFDRFLKSRAGLYDAVLLSRPHIATRYVNQCRALCDGSIIYYGHDVHFRRMMAQAEVDGQSIDTAEIAEMKALELAVCNASDWVLYPSEDEARFMAGEVQPGVHCRAVTAYCYPEADLIEAEARIGKPRSDGPLRLLFVGGFAHRPNVDGIVWFCETVVPLLRAQGTEFELKIVGSNPDTGIYALEQNDIAVLGFVSDEQLVELYRDADLVIAPLRFGAGVKGKVIEAMARGVPVATTSIGAQGIHQAENLLFVADDAMAFAVAVGRAFEGGEAFARARAAVDFVRRNYSREAMKGAFGAVLGRSGREGVSG